MWQAPPLDEGPVPWVGGELVKQKCVLGVGNAMVLAVARRIDGTAPRHRLLGKPEIAKPPPGDRTERSVRSVGLVLASVDHAVGADHREEVEDRTRGVGFVEAFRFVMIVIDDREAVVPQVAGAIDLLACRCRENRVVGVIRAAVVADDARRYFGMANTMILKCPSEKLLNHMSRM